MTYSVKTIYPQFKGITAHKAVMKRFETARKKMAKTYTYKNETPEVSKSRLEVALDQHIGHHLVVMRAFSPHKTNRYYYQLIKKVVVLVTPESMYYERRGAFYEMMMERDRVLGMRRSLPDEIVNEIMTYL